MKLVQPTDFELLAALQDGRNVAAALCLDLDRNRAYLNTRLPELLDHALVVKVGPATNSGLYELTDAGEAALAHRDQYGELSPDVFEDVVQDAAGGRTGVAE